MYSRVPESTQAHCTGPRQYNVEVQLAERRRLPLRSMLMQLEGVLGSASAQTMKQDDLETSSGGAGELLEQRRRRRASVRSAAQVAASRAADEIMM